MNIPKQIILHCSVILEGKPFDAADIDRMHKKRSVKKISYHDVIKLEGTVENGRSEKENGAHCVGHNSKSIGICYIGGIAKDGKTSKDTRTKEQKEALYKLVESLLIKYDLTIDDVHGHYEFANKDCPCFKIETFRKEFNEWRGKRKTMLLTTDGDKNSWKNKILSIVLKIIDYFLKK